MTTLAQMQQAVAAKQYIGIADTETKNQALRNMAAELIADTETILAANEKDLAAARGIISEVMLDRLALSESRIKSMAEGILQVAELPDPVSEVLDDFVRPNGIHVRKVRVPMGVIAIIYESRPNVTSDAAALAVKAGSSCILRCGKEAKESAAAITASLRKGLEKAGLPGDTVIRIEDTSRDSANELMRGRGYIDLLIPRGGKGLIKACVENSIVPVLETGSGICHVYVDDSADQEMALRIIENAKCSRPSVCNAEEVLLVNEKIAAEFLPKLQKMLTADRAAKGAAPVELRLCPAAAEIIPGTPAGEEDFDTEFLDYILAVKVVRDVEEAILHINAHSTHHSEAIITADSEHASRFTKCIDSAAVYVNTSTRFTDGGEFGLGCEMGISTQKLHARGPMGLRELCSYKYIIESDGSVR